MQISEVEDESPSQVGGSVADCEVRCWLTSASREVARHDGDQVAGRDPAANIWLESPKVSRRHARFVVNGASVIVEDLGSKDGTFVSGTRVVGPIALKPGDKVRIGPFIFMFRVEMTPSSTETEINAILQPRMARLRILC